MRSAVVAVALVLLTVSCGSGGGVRGTVRVSAAASLSDAFEEMALAFEAAHPDVEVALNPGGSSRLAQQILEGAPVYAFASAGPSHMERLRRHGLVSEPVVIATNTMVIAVPPGNPAGITGPEDFSRSDLVLGLCAPVVPCGEVAREALGRAGVLPAGDTEEPDVRSLLTKIEEGELDGGIVYVTDVTAAADRVDTVPLGPGAAVATQYSMAVVDGSVEAEAATRFVEFVTSPPGQDILSRYGFGPP